MSIRWFSSAAKLDKKKPFEFTVNLPKTLFPMRANACVNELKYRERTTSYLYQWQAKQSRDKEFVIHDGPPYANGDLHMGHALNKILKDVINRYKLLQGFKIRYIPGWDCHGLPIENKALASLGKSGSFREIDPLLIRKRARETALEAVQSQKEKFQEWAVMGDWDNAYLTLQPEYITRQLEVFKEMFNKGLIERRMRPVYWSPSSRTALAEAELEYKDDHESRAVYVKLPLRNDPNTSLIIWTTTPWTLPANVAVGVGADIEYSTVCIDGGENLIIAKDRVNELKRLLPTASNFQTIKEFTGTQLEGVEYLNPINSQHTGRVLLADFVSNDTGTGAVHLAPAHGFDDYEVCKRNRLPVVSLVDADGKYTEQAGVDLQGLPVFREGAAAVVDALKNSGMLLLEEPYRHKYPYDWRTKKPVMVRATEQWFVDLCSVKQKALECLASVQIIPQSERLKSYISSRDEWCISRQRAWGVPIPAFYTADGQVLMNSEIIKHVTELLRVNGADAWWSMSERELLPAAYYTEGVRKGTDTMDVWFDSGCSWASVFGVAAADSNDVADLYLEGSDQHRGWFQSSLLLSSAVRSVAPYRTLLTHGFVLDESGRKMSKSQGNVVQPDHITRPQTEKRPKGAKQPNLGLGVDCLRFWACSADYTKDITVGDQLIKGLADNVRRIRNTCRFLLANLDGFINSNLLPLDRMQPVDRYMLSQLYAFNRAVMAGYEGFEVDKVQKEILRFTSTELSSFYFDITKDRLYNDARGSEGRQSAQTALYHILHYYHQSFAPILPHLAEELFEYVNSDNISQSYFTTGWKEAPVEWKDKEIEEDFTRLRQVRDAVNVELERCRQEKIIGASSEASVCISTVKNNKLSKLIQKYSENLEELFITSQVSNNDIDTNSLTLYNCKDEKFAVNVKRHSLSRCVRCWKLKAKEQEGLCQRCSPIVDYYKK